MAKRYTAKTRSGARRARVKEDKFLQKYGYTSDDEQLFEKFRSKRSKLGADLEEYEDLNDYFSDEYDLPFSDDGDIWECGPCLVGGYLCFCGNCPQK